MAVVAAVGIEGVLAAREPGSVFGASAPIRSGFRLLAALSEHYKVVLLSDESVDTVVEHWLKQQNLSSLYGQLLTRKPVEAEMEHDELRAAQYGFLKGCGFNVELVIDHDPAVCNRMLQQGCASMLFIHPTYLRPEFRPDDDRGVRAWDEIAAEVEHQSLLKAGDVRLTWLNDEESPEADIEDEVMS